MSPPSCRGCEGALARGAARRETVAALAPPVVEGGPGSLPLLRSVNTPAELAAAAAEIGG